MKAGMTHILPQELRNPVRLRGLVLGGLYVVFAMLQLFTFEHFAEVTAGYALPGAGSVAYLVSVLLPLAELAALPFLLSMTLPRRLLQTSRIMTVTCPSLWLIIALWTAVTGNVGENTGIFGATLPAYNGWWFVLFAALLLWAAILVVRELPYRLR